MLGLSEREQRRQRVARASRVTNRDLDDGDRDSNDIGIAVTPKVHETIVIDLSSESENEELQDNHNLHQELEGHNVQVKELETELIRAKEKPSQRLPSLTEQLNYADSRLESFMQHGHRVDHTNDTHSQLVEFEEKKQLKQENERLHKEITELKCQLNNIIQRDLAEHTHLNILNRLLLQTRHDLLHENISPLVVIETFDNLSSQLREIADRHLENIPVGFGSIMGVISHQNGRANIEDGNEVYTSRKQQLLEQNQDPGVRSSGISQIPSMPGSRSNSTVEFPIMEGPPGCSAAYEWSKADQHM
ncbi:hypothetical protein C8J55DRAFT_484260 [Lentinula edodes]|uniref:Uncharacterized protein n=1 Tax=Lentinula lateritia TaxID=40482 RepID=A0A9W9B5H1_9AGAR|nr:hypothetical protein C8J55DRAFT_484260 [Lentinula edodes]